MWSSGTPARRPPGVLDDLTRYSLIHPTLLLHLRFELRQRLYLQIGDILSYDIPEVSTASLLAKNARDRDLRGFFGSFHRMS